MPVTETLHVPAQSPLSWWARKPGGPITPLMSTAAINTAKQNAAARSPPWYTTGSKSWSVAKSQIDIPSAAQSGIVAISAGCNHSVALKYTGQVIAWGDDTFHQTEVPTAARSGITVISAGCEHTLALTNRGRIVAWGDDSVGQTDVPSLPSGYRWFAIALRKDPENTSIKDDLSKLWGEMTQPERQLAIKLTQ